MKLPGFLEDVREEANRWKLIWGVRSGYIMTAWFATLAVISDIAGILPTRVLYGLIPLKLFTNLLMWVGLRTRRFVILTTSINSVTDVLVFTVIIYFTGGPFSPLITIFFIEIAIMALLSNLGVTILFSIMTVVFFGTMSFLIFAGILPQQPGITGGLSLEFILVSLASLTFVLGVTALSASSILRRLVDREKDLLAYARKLEDAGRLKSEFIRNITHEFRTPIHGILGLAAVMEDGIYGPVTVKQKEAIAGINSCSQALLELIDDLMDLARFEMKKMEVKATLLRVDDIIPGIISTARWIQGKKKLEISTDIAPDLPELLTDKGKLVRILINIIFNAVKFTPEGGKIMVRVRRNNVNAVDISVEDTGIGISQADLPFIFDEFRQVDGSMSRQYGGAGLGLSLVKKLTDLISGRISVVSTLGQGSVFTVTIPLRVP